SLKDQGICDQASLRDPAVARLTHERRLELIRNLCQRGIRNIRLGMSNHEIDLEKPETWQPTTDMITDFAHGVPGCEMRISLDLHHFGIEDRFRYDGKGALL